MKEQDIIDTYKKIRDVLKDDISLSCLHYMYNAALIRMDEHNTGNEPNKIIMNREEAKNLFRNDVDSYGKPKAIMGKLDLIFDNLQPLKMYHINPRNWGINWYICATCKQAALDTLLKRLENDAMKELENPHARSYTVARDKYTIWAKATLKKLPKNYTIDEYNEGGIIETEVS